MPFEPYHRSWIEFWRTYFLKAIEEDEVYLMEMLKEANQWEVFSSEFILNKQLYHTFAEYFYEWGLTNWKSYFDQAINDIPDKDESFYFLGGMTDRSKVYFGHFFKSMKLNYQMNVLEYLIVYMNPTKTIEWYTTFNEPKYKDLISAMSQVRLIRPGDVANRNRCLIRQLMYCDVESDLSAEEWWFDFLRMLHSFEALLPASLILDPAFTAKLTREQEEDDAKLEELLFTYDVDDKVKPILKDFRNQQDYYDYFPEALPPKDEKASDYDLREYQVELIQNGLRGKNSIIMAPTGCGKTMCAIHIMREHMDERVHLRPPPHQQNGSLAHKTTNFRCMFVAPTTPLVLQQTRSIRAHLGDKYTVTNLLKQQNEASNLKKFLAHDVVVTTPQLFINMLRDKNEGERVYFSDLTLIIFDECHHCNSHHPYKNIMNSYTKITQLDQRPQVIGLTASIGTARNLDSDKCRDYFMEMAVNLSADCLDAVYKNRGSLLAHLKPPVDDIISIRAKKSLISTFIDETCKHLLAALKNQGDQPLLEHCLEHRIPGVMDTKFIPQLSKLSAYQGSVSDVNLNACIANIVKSLHFYSYLWELAAIVPLASVIHFMEAHISQFNGTLTNSSLNPLIVQKSEQLTTTIKHYIQGVYGNCAEIKKPPPKIPEICVRLITLCKDQLLTNPHSRILIFCSMRFIATELSNYFTQIATKLPNLNIKPNYLIASGKGKFGRQSQREQEEILKGFHGGEVNILFATSIAEEGLDIAKCNLIIKYNTLGNERTLIQRRGRARAEASRSILLTISEMASQNEILNLQKEKLMKDVSFAMHGMGIGTFKKELEEKRKEMEKHSEEKMRMLVQNKKSLQRNDFGLHCVNCKTKFTDSMNLRFLGDIVISLDPTIHQKVYYNDKRVGTKGPIMTIVMDIACKECQKLEDTQLGKIVKLGEVIMIDGHFYIKIILKNISFLKKTSLPPGTGSMNIGEQKAPLSNANAFENRTNWDAVRNSLFLIGNAVPEDIQKYNQLFSTNQNEAFHKCIECERTVKGRAIVDKEWIKKYRSAEKSLKNKNYF
uniref:RNA helicase n=1 Tax=Rhabditophanes sp. KR3021 TaxID=114890 RepID=A0AC35UBC4_9BILA